MSGGDFDRRRKLESNDGIVVARSETDLEKVGRLRYATYVQRDGKHYPHANVATRCFIEPIDTLSFNLFAENVGVCIASIRLTQAIHAKQDEALRSLLSAAPVSLADPDDVMLVSRLVVSQSMQARLKTSALLNAAYRLSLKSGATIGLMSTRKSLVPLFIKLGFVECGVTYEQEVAGPLAVMVLNLRDRMHLSNINSLFLRTHDEVVFRQEVMA